jgi:hypothetical protein
LATNERLPSSHCQMPSHAVAAAVARRITRK